MRRRIHGRLVLACYRLALAVVLAVRALSGSTWVSWARFSPPSGCVAGGLCAACDGVTAVDSLCCGGYTHGSGGGQCGGPGEPLCFGFRRGRYVPLFECGKFEFVRHGLAAAVIGVLALA